MPAYPVPPGRRIPYDADGSQAFQYNSSSGVSFQYSTANLKSWNDEFSGTIQNGNGTLFFGSRPSVGLYEYLFFPGARDLTHVAAWMCFNHSPDLAYSTNAITPGDGGTWTSIGGIPRITGGGGGSTATSYRTYMVAVAASGVTALRWVWTPVDGNDWVGRLHVYATRSASDTARQVAFVDSGGARLTKDFDYEDVGQGAILKWKSPTLFSAPDQLYVKNFSSQTAHTVVVSAEVNADDSGNSTNLPGETTLSLDDVTYTATETFATIAPGAMVGPLFVKYAPLSADPVSIELGRAKIAVGSWT